MIMLHFLKLGFVPLLLMAGLASSASAQLSTSDQDTMTRALEGLSAGWDANGIINKPAYNDSVWTGFFESFFSTHKLTTALSEYLVCFFASSFEQSNCRAILRTDKGNTATRGE